MNWLTYKAGDLREQFDMLKHLESFILIPLFDRASDRLLNELIHEPQKYGISDSNIESLKTVSLRAGNPSYHVVANGRLVEMILQLEEIDVEDEDESWRMASGIFLKGNPEEVRELHDRFREFVGNQNLSDLIIEARQELEKGKTHHLYNEMFKFYFLS